MSRGLVAGFVAVALVASCTDFTIPVDPTGGLPDVVVDDPSFSRDVIPILEKRCSIGGCHSLAAEQAGLVLTPGRAYDAVVNVQSRLAPTLVRVAPGEPESSFFLRLLSSDPEVRMGFSRMPLASSPLTPNQIATITNWVRQGAARN